MDNFSKNQNSQSTNQPAGQIFAEQKSGQPSSAYEQAMQSMLEPETPPVEQAPPSQPSPMTQSRVPMSPPPFAEDNRKRLVLIIIIIIGLILLVFALFKFLTRKSTPSTTTKTQTPAEQKTTLTYWGLWEDEAVMKGVFDEYTKTHTNIVIKYTKQDPKQYRERLQSAIDRGEGPDIYRFHNSWVPMLTKYLAPIPKATYADTDFEKTFYPVASSDLKIGSNYYGIPLMIDGLLLFYNVDILKGGNVDPPVTWVDVQNAVPRLTVRTDKLVTSAIALGTAENIEHFSDILGLMMLQNGTQLSKSLFSCVDPSTTTCAVEALTFYRKFAEPPTNTWDDTLDNSIVAFAGGKVGMIIAPSWQAVTIKQMNPNLNFKTTVPPQLPCDKQPCPTVNWGTYWVEGVSPKSKNTQASWDLLKYLSQADTMQKLYAEESKQRLFGEPYSRVDLGKSLADNQYLSPLIIAAPTMKSFYLASRTSDGDTGLDSSLIKYLKDAVNATIQNTSPETALKTADSGFTQVFSRFGITPAK